MSPWQQGSFNVWGNQSSTGIAFLTCPTVSGFFMLFETLHTRFGYLTANDRPRFAVSGFTLAACPYLGDKIRGWLLAAALFSWEIVIKITFRWKTTKWALNRNITSQTWDCNVLGCKKPCGTYTGMCRPTGSCFEAPDLERGIHFRGVF